MKFSEKLIRLRKIKGMTQDELASAVGVSRQAVYKWESGQSYPEVLKLVELKTLFGISIDDLLDESYEVALPEKKKRKRNVKGAQEVAAPAVSTVVEEPTVKEEMPLVEEKKEISKEAPVEEEKEEAFAPILATEQKAEPTAEEAKVEKNEPTSDKAAPEKKVGFFGRLFGRR